MLVTPVATYIPIYSLAQSSRNGDSRFEVDESMELTHQQKALFFVPHRQDFYKMVWVKRGNSRFWADMAPYTIQPNRLYFTSPQQVMLKEEAITCAHAVSICFTEEFLGLEDAALLKSLPIIQNPYDVHELVLSAEDVAFLDDITAKLLAEYRHRQGWQSSMLLAYLRVFLIYMSRLYNEQYAGKKGPANRELLKNFKALVVEHYTQLHDVAAYAGMLNLSAGHFSEQIKAQSGRTAIEHIHDRLLLEAKRLLFHTDATMKEIAFQLGFEEPSYFNRFFKRLTGSTPLDYRSTIRKMYH